LYTGGNGLDEERTTAATKQVQSWRRSGELPFPEVSGSRKEELAGTVDYPPKGSPGAYDPKGYVQETAEPLSGRTVEMEDNGIDDSTGKRT